MVDPKTLGAIVCAFFRLRSHLIELSELNTEVPFFCNLEHGKTWICVWKFLPKWSGTPATELAHNVANLQAQIHVFPCSKSQKKGIYVFSSLRSATGDLSLKKGAALSCTMWGIMRNPRQWKHYKVYNMNFSRVQQLHCEVWICECV